MAQTAEEESGWLSIQKFVDRTPGGLSRSEVGHLCRTDWHERGIAFKIGRRWLVRADAYDLLVADEVERKQRAA